MTISYQCILCDHYWGNGKCDAYEKQIPKEILSGNHDHIKPFKGDNGIRFKPVKDKKPNA